MELELTSETCTANAILKAIRMMNWAAKPKTQLHYAVLLDGREKTHKSYVEPSDLISEQRYYNAESIEVEEAVDNSFDVEIQDITRTQDVAEYDWRSLSDISSIVKSSWLNTFTTFVVKNPSTSVSRFSASAIRPVITPNHPHPEEAGIRNTATADVIDWAARTGRLLYDVDSSGRTRHAGAKGSHDFHTLRDFTSKGYRDRVPKGALVSFIDSDYYHEDLNKYAGHDMVLFTFRPKYLVGYYKSSYYEIIDENTIRLIVPGGPKEGYRHPIWNYDTDYIRFQKRGYTYIYRADSVQYSEEHLLVFLSLVATTMNPFNLTFRLAGLDLKETGREKQRLVPLPNGGYYRYVLIKDKTGRPRRLFQATTADGQAAISIPAEIVSIIATKAQEQGGLMPGDILGISEHKLTVPESTLLYVIFSKGNPINSKDLIRYTLYGEEPLEDGQSAKLSSDTSADEVTKSGQQHCPPLTDDPLGVPNDNKRNEATSRQTRVEAVRNLINPRDKLPNLDEWMSEFNTRLLAGRRGLPLPRKEVIKRQSRPMQVARNKRLGTTVNEKSKIKTFTKNEPVDPTKPARIITQYNTEHCIELSRYTYALKDNILSNADNIPWYAPGKTPQELHKGIDKIFAISKKMKMSVLGIDYSKYDGSQTKFMREFERKLYLMYFQEDKHLSALFDEEIESSSKSSCSYSDHDILMRFSVLFERGSGSPMTTDGNTIIAAFIAYCYHRKCGRRPALAWSLIGMKGGDDGVDLGDFKGFEDVASGCFGMKVTGGQFEKGWVPFYSRLFVRIEGGVSSFCDPLRALGKWHIGMNKQVSAEQSLMNKVLGYEVTDRRTVIIKDLIKLCFKCYPHLVKDLESSADYTVDSYLKAGIWRPPPVADELQFQILTEYLSIPADVLTAAAASIRACPSVSALQPAIVQGKAYEAHPLNVSFGRGFFKLTRKAEKVLGAGRGRSPKINKRKNKNAEKQRTGPAHGQDNEPRAAN